MEDNKLTEEELKEIKTLNEDKNRLTIDFGRVKTDMILVKAQLNALEKMDEDMVAKFKGLETKSKKMMEKFNKKYGDGSINLDDGTFTPNKK
tara:strand:+ start:3614 stop:3889 length:276 start_codon:yes stop_codon:yes gene_type:complete